MKVKKSIAILGALLTIVFSLSACGDKPLFEDKRYLPGEVPHCYFYTDDGFVRDFSVHDPVPPKLIFEYDGNPHTPKVEMRYQGKTFHKGFEDAEYKKSGNSKLFTVRYIYSNGLFFGFTPPTEVGDYAIQVLYYINDKTGYVNEFIYYFIAEAKE